MDLTYLHFLQDFREATGGIFTPFMEELSAFIISFWPLVVCAFIYWVVKKNDGFVFLFGYTITCLLNGVIKLTACVYRPWIRDASIVPAGNAMKGATGYSFPSGHSSKAGYFFGSFAKWLWNKCKVLAVICIVMGLLCGFSRNYLGVHTPQDVFVGLAVGVVVVFLAPWIYKKMEAGKGNSDLIWLLGTFVLCVAVLLYVNLKPYPLDYVDGKLLVDPVAMMPDCYFAVGAVLGCMISWVVDRRFIKFQPSAKNKYVVLVAFVMIIPIYFWMTYASGMMTPFITKGWAKLISGLVLYAYILMLVPVILQVVERKLSAKTPATK